MNVKSLFAAATIAVISSVSAQSFDLNSLPEPRRRNQIKIVNDYLHCQLGSTVWNSKSQGEKMEMITQTFNRGNSNGVSFETYSLNDWSESLHKRSNREYRLREVDGYSGLKFFMSREQEWYCKDYLNEVRRDLVTYKGKDTWCQVRGFNRFSYSRDSCTDQPGIGDLMNEFLNIFQNGIDSIEY